MLHTWSQQEVYAVITTNQHLKVTKPHHADEFHYSQNSRCYSAKLVLEVFSTMIDLSGGFIIIYVENTNKQTNYKDLRLSKEMFFTSQITANQTNLYVKLVLASFSQGWL